MILGNVGNLVLKQKQDTKKKKKKNPGWRISISKYKYVQEKLKYSKTFPLINAGAKKAGILFSSQ